MELEDYGCFFSRDLYKEYDLSDLITVVLSVYHLFVKTPLSVQTSFCFAVCRSASFQLCVNRSFLIANA